MFISFSKGKLCRPYQLRLDGSLAQVDIRTGFQSGDMLRVVADVEHLKAGALLPVLGYRILRDEAGHVESVTAYVPGRTTATVYREHVRFPEPAAVATEVLLLGMLPPTIYELEVDVYAESLRLDRATEARVVPMYPARLAA